MRTAQALVLASLVFASSAFAAVSPIGAAPLSATGPTMFLLNENPEDDTPVAPPEATTQDELDVTALVDEAADADWTPARRPAVSSTHPSDDNS